MEDEKKTEQLDRIVQALIPWWNSFEAEVGNEFFIANTEENIDLDEFQLIPLSEISIPNMVEDIHEFVNKRFNTLFSAAYQVGFTLITLYVGRHSGTSVYIGVKGDKEQAEYLNSILKGVLPGRIATTSSKELRPLKEILPTDLNAGGMVTGIPSLRDSEDEKHRFEIASVIKSMYGREFALALISRPVFKSELQMQLKELINLRDACHEIALQTKEESESKSDTHSESNTTNKRTVNWNIIIANGSINRGKSSGTIDSTMKQQGTSISKEVQNGMAVEMEKIANHFIERMYNGFNTGYWETSVSYAATDELSSNILGGSMVGELSKPSKQLFPARIYTGVLDNERRLYLPIDTPERRNGIFPKVLSTYLTGPELVQLASLPKESLPGFEVKRSPKLALTDSVQIGEISLGTIVDNGMPIPGNEIKLSLNDLNKHLFVGGLTGSGKTTTVKHILKEVKKQNVPFLILESVKREYRELMRGEEERLENSQNQQLKLRVFTIGDSTVSPIGFNPFYIQKGVLPGTHIDNLKAIFNASFSLYGPMPHIVEKCLYRIYQKKGWNFTTGLHPYFLKKNGKLDKTKYENPEHLYWYPTLEDLKNEVDAYVLKSNYAPELRDNIRAAIIVRLESLCVGGKGLMFNTYDVYPMKELLSRDTIMEMEALSDDDDKAFFTGLMLTFISEYRQVELLHEKKENGLQHLLVVEEAHRLLKNMSTERTSEMMGNPKGKAIDLFCNAIAEMRSAGQGVAVVEQIPTKIAPEVIKNSNTKIIHRLVAKDDQSLMAGSLSISDEDALYLNRLQTGFALCHKEGMERPVECKINFEEKGSLTGGSFGEERLGKLMRKDSMKPKPLHCDEAYELSSQLGDEGSVLVVRLFNSLCVAKEGEISDVLSAGRRECIRLLIKKDISMAIYGKEEVVTDFFTLQILRLISQGIYRKSFELPIKTKNAVLSFLHKSSMKNTEEFYELLKQQWKPEKPSDFVLEVVYHLMYKKLKNIHEEKKRITERERGLIDRILEAFRRLFFEKKQEPIQTIKKREIKRMLAEFFIIQHTTIQKQLVSKLYKVFS